MKNFFSYLNIFKDESEEEESINIEKSLIRHEIRTKKRLLTEEQKSEAAKKVFEKIENMTEFIHAKTIMMYWSTKNEIPTHEFIVKWKDKKQILLPVVIGHMMILKQFTSEAAMTKNQLGIWEPEAQNEYKEKIDLAIVPGIAFDKKKKRLGRGRGYYDIYLKNKKLQKWGICYDFQLVDIVPTTTNDVKMNRVICPMQIID